MLSSDILRILALFDSGELLPRGHDFRKEFRRDDWKSERDVARGIRRLGHELRMLALCDDLDPLRQELREFRPHVVFNLLEEFAHEGAKVPVVAAFLGRARVRYTGCGPAVLRLCKDKARVKSLLLRAGVSTPAFQVVKRGSRPRRMSGLEFPLFVKPKAEDASYGIAAAGVVRTARALRERVLAIHRSGEEALVEPFIAGRELYASVLPGHPPLLLPLREVRFGALPPMKRVASYKVKWDKLYRRKMGIRYMFAKGWDPAVLRRTERCCLNAFRVLGLDGYVRIDLRVSPDGTPYILEVNPNPYLAKKEDFADSARGAGISWEELIARLIRSAPRKR